MIFISFSSIDVATAKQLYQRLTEAGYDCRDLFLDRSTIKHGEDWEQALFQNLHNCEALLVVCSPDWLASKWCFAELAIAKCQPTTTILPLVVHELASGDWEESGLGSLQRRNFKIPTDDDQNSDFENLCQRLDELGLGPDDRLQPPISRHPDRADFRFLEFTKWAALPDLQQNLHLADEQQNFLRELQAELDGGEHQHLHIAGTAGCGKTRLILEACRSDRLKPQVVYYIDPADLILDKFLHYLTTARETRSYIVVVDDCHSVEYRAIWNRLAEVDATVRFVTISHDDNVGTATKVFRVPDLPQSKIEDILNSYESAEEIDVSGYAEFCRNSPRFAHLVGASFKAHRGSIAIGPDEDWIIPRVICGRTDSDSATGQTLLTVARFAALFDRFGVELPHQTEVAEIAQMITEFHPKIGLGEVLVAISELRFKRILQGRKTVAMVPKALQGILWRQWWTIYGSQFRVQNIERLSGHMRNYFLLELEGTIETAQLADVSESLLTHDSWFYEWESYHPLWGSRLLSVLADAAPDTAFECIENFIGRSKVEELREVAASTGKNHWGVIQIVKDATMRRSTAARAALLLRQFALAESSDNGDATKRFCAYFTLGQGENSPTELSPVERFVLLDEMLASGCPDERGLALKACRTGLSIHWYRSGLGMLPTHGEQLQLWRAQSEEELKSCYTDLWNRVCRFAETVSDAKDADAAVVVLGTALFALAQETIAEHCIASVKVLCSKRKFDVEPVIKTIIGLWRRVDSLSEETRVSLRGLYDSIVSSSFEAKLQRYVGMSFVNDIPNDALPYSPISDADAETRCLADACVENPELLIPHLDWLITTAKRAWQFGKDIGDRDKDLSLLPRIVDHQRHLDDANTAFLGGYLDSFRQRSRSDYEKKLASFSSDLELKPLVSELLCRSGGLTENIAAKISEQLDDGSITPDTLKYFYFDRNLTKVSDNVFLHWMQHLVNAGSANLLGLCINFLHRRLFFDSSNATRVIPLEFLQSVVCHDVFWDELLLVEPADESVDYEWNQLAELLVEQDADRAVAVAVRYFNVFGEHRRLPHRASSGSIDKAIYRILEECPERTWNAFFVALDHQRGEHEEGLLYWLSGRQHSIDRDNEGLWSQTPHDRLWAWIDCELPRRVRQVARFLPPLLTGNTVTPVTSQFLIRYSTFHDACMILVSSVQSGIVYGKFKDEYANRLTKAMDAEAKESNPVIAVWLNRHIECLTAAIERETESERWKRERNEQR